MRKKSLPRFQAQLNPESIRRTKHILSITPTQSTNYKGCVCWHGCDKVSRIGPSGLGGGGGN